MTTLSIAAPGAAHRLAALAGGLFGGPLPAVAEESARVRRLCPAGGALAFEEGRMGVDRILAVRRTGTGAAAMPGTPADRYTLLDRP